MNLRRRFHPTVVSNLERIQEEFPSAIIAGGAVRDLILGSPIKDIDIFIDREYPELTKLLANWVRNPQTADTYWKQVLKDNGWNAHLKTGSLSTNDKEIDLVLTLYNPNYEGNRIFGDGISPYNNHSSKIARMDIIFCSKTALDYFDRCFDFGICKALYDGQQYVLDSDFLDDVKQGTITLTGRTDKSRIDYSMKSHFPRIQAKYPNYKLVIPNGYSPSLL